MTERADIALWLSDGSTERALSRPLEVGGHPRSDFTVAGPDVLQQHVRVIPEPRGARLVPAPGVVVRINGIAHDAPQGLMPGDRIEIGASVLEVFASNPGHEPEQPWRIVSVASGATVYLAQELRIGRDDASDICLHDKHASRHHARLVLQAGSAWLRDLGSRNGSFVNGDRVHGATRLFSGDELRIDRTNFKVLGPHAPQSKPTVEGFSRSRLRPGLYLVDTTTTGSVGWHPLLSGKTLIGRASDCDLQFQDRSISAHHCEIQQGPGGVFVRDLGSSNGTRINERRIRTAAMREGDRLSIGRVQLSLREIRALRRAGGWLGWLRRFRHTD